MTTSNVVVSVLKSGGVYTVEYVNKLANAIARHSTVDYEFVCLTDTPDADFNENVSRTIQLTDDLPGWWSKIEMFKPGLFPGQTCVFFDLDTIILDNIDDILGNDYKRLTMLDDFYYPGSGASGVLAWKHDDHTHIYERFFIPELDPMRQCIRGDQQWIAKSVYTYDTFQALFPGSMVSFKKDCTRTPNNVITPPGAKVLCFHGTPKPHELQLIIVKENWI